MHDANSVDDITKKCFEPNNQVKNDIKKCLK